MASAPLLKFKHPREQAGSHTTHEKRFSWKLDSGSDMNLVWNASSYRALKPLLTLHKCSFRFHHSMTGGLPWKAINANFKRGFPPGRWLKHWYTDVSQQHNTICQLRTKNFIHTARLKDGLLLITYQPSGGEHHAILFTVLTYPTRLSRNFGWWETRTRRFSSNETLGGDHESQVQVESRYQLSSHFFPSWGNESLIPFQAGCLLAPRASPLPCNQSPPLPSQCPERVWEPTVGCPRIPSPACPLPPTIFNPQLQLLTCVLLLFAFQIR